MKNTLFSVVITLMMILGMTTASVVTNERVVYANDLGGIMDSITGSQTQVIGGETKKKVVGLSNELQQILIVIVMAFLMMSGLWTATKFAGVGDDAKKKTTLKTALTFQILGIIFLASYFGFMKFGFNSLKLFN